MTAHATDAAATTAPRFPPVTQLTIGSLALVVIGGIVMAGNFPNPPSLAVPVVLLAGSAVLWAASLLLLSRHPGFAWPIFFQVARWALLAYVVIAGMIEYAFVFDKTRGAQLLVMTLMLALFMLNVPVLIAFTVTRYQQTR